MGPDVDQGVALPGEAGVGEVAAVGAAVVARGLRQRRARVSRRGLLLLSSQLRNIILNLFYRELTMLTNVTLSLSLNPPGTSPPGW